MQKRESCMMHHPRAAIGLADANISFDAGLVSVGPKQALIGQKYGNEIMRRWLFLKFY